MVDDHAAPRETIADACRVLANTGLAELFTGHVSHRTGDESLLIPAHLHEGGRGVESIRSDDVIEVAFDGSLLEETHLVPPDELIIHTAVLEARDDLHSVAHAHPLYATALSIAGVEIQPTGLDAALLDGPARVYDPGPRLLYDAGDGAGLVDTLGDDNAVLVRGHGVVTAGRSVGEATARMWLVERAARLQAIAEMVGGSRPFADRVDTETFLGESPEDFLEAAFAFLCRQHLG